MLTDDSYILDAKNTRDLTPEALDTEGRLRILPADYWASTTPAERGLLGWRYGIYNIPTVELVAHLREIIAGRRAIEIGAGNGVLAEALGITATDSRMQEKSPFRQIYLASKQPAVRYGDNVIECDAYRAVREYNPEVVIACWVTHLYDPERPAAAGSAVGVDEEDVLRHCKQYVFIGNREVHRKKPIRRWHHTIEYPPYLYSRAQNGSPEFIATWPGIR